MGYIGVRALPWVTTILIVAGAACFAQPVSPSYAREVQPVLTENCSMCHGAVEQMSGLRLDHREPAARVLTPGSDGVSELIRRITSKDTAVRMPPWPTAISLTPSDTETLNKWIAAGAPWETRTPSPSSVRLFDAIDRGDLARVRALLSNPSLIDAADADGTTPLMHAVLNADLDCVRLLLQKGADPNLRNHFGATALMWAVDDSGKVEELLKGGAAVNVKSNRGTTPLLAASLIWGNHTVVDKLLAKGADVSAIDSDGWTPLVKAAASGDSAIVRTLLSKGATPEQATNTFTPLTIAAWNGHVEIVRLLLENGAGVNTKDANFGVTPLAAAAFFDREAIARILIEKGAGVNTETKSIWAVSPGTPLMIAAYAESANPGLTKLLLSHGAKVGLTTPEGQTALGRARQKGDTEVVRALRAAGDSEPAVSAAVRPAESSRGLPDLRTAVERSLALLEKSDVRFFQQTGCKSCHNQSLPAMAYGVARDRGFRFDEAVARRQSDNVLSIMAAQRERVLQLMDDEGPADSGGYALAGLAAMGYPSDRNTAAFARGLAARQLPEGNWHVESARPPMEYSSVSATALAIRALTVYGSERRKREYQNRVERATKWLVSQRPRFTEERVFQLLGLAWANADSPEVRRLAAELVAEQRGDGGWGQLATLPSDAYATGQALYALNQASGMPTARPEYKRGVAFLRESQLEDGSWLVKTRAVAIQPYFESGFPHGKDQFISAAGTCWAAMALMLTEPAVRRN